jgi:hypothetical protein
MLSEMAIATPGVQSFEFVHLNLGHLGGFVRLAVLGTGRWYNRAIAGAKIIHDWFQLPLWLSA